MLPKVDVQWSREWPDEVGYWWFYGWPFGNHQHEPLHSLLRVCRGGDGKLIIIGDGHFWFKAENADGWFARATTPDPPEEAACVE